MFLAFVISRLAHVHVKAYVRIVCTQNELWQKAKDYPLASFLSDKSSYIFKSVTQDAETEEFYDETRRYCYSLSYCERSANSQVSLRMVENFDNLAPVARYV